VREWDGFTWLKIFPAAASWEDDEDLSGSTKGEGGIFDQLSHSQLLEEDSAP
jgi:hypothetical protein